MFVIWSGLSHNLLIGIRLFSTQSPIHLTYSILLVASFRGADIASATYLYKFSNSYSQFLHQILVASFRGADITSATYLYKFPNSYSQFSSSYLTSFPFLYTLFFLPLSSLLIVPVSSCSFLYNLLIILQFSSLLTKKKTSGRKESLPKSPRKLISH